MADGFSDVSGEFPKRQTVQEPGVNPKARGVSSDKSKVTGRRGPRVSSETPQTSASALSEPTQTGSPVYPYNQVRETTSGHMIEYDDTPGRERVSIRHRTGAQVEMRPDGSVIFRSNNNLYEIVAGNKDAIVRGSVNIVVESNADIRVGGDVNLQADGDLNHLVQGNYNCEVQGNYNVRVHGNMSTRTTGGMLSETRGNVIVRNLSNKTERVLGDWRNEIGGGWFTTVEGEIHQRSYGQFSGSYYGGLITLNGEDAEGNVGQGSLVSHSIYNDSFWGATVVTSGAADFGAEVTVGSGLDVGGEGKFSGTVHTPSLEGTAKRAMWATTAGSAPTGSSNPQSASPSSPDSPEDREEDPTSSEEVVDVTGTTDDFILDMDRSSITGHNLRRLNTYEVVARARNAFLRGNSDWLQDQLDNGAILSTIQNGSPPGTGREATEAQFNNPGNGIGPVLAGNTTRINTNTTLPVEAIPQGFLLTEGISRNSSLSPNFKVSHMTGGDNLAASLIPQAGLGADDIAQNMQLVAYNVLEPLRSKYADTWTIAEGLYNLLPDEQIDSGSVTLEMVQGLGVGIQFVTQSNSSYYDAAVWIRNNLVFDKLVLSYIDYDPTGINEPTLIVTIKPGQNSRTVMTEYNHNKISDNIVEVPVDDT